MDNLNEKATLERKIERDKLFLITENLSITDEYQKMRYEREIEANEFVKLRQSGWTKEKAAMQARKNADAIVRNWKV
jgi:hypothetical protein